MPSDGTYTELLSIFKFSSQFQFSSSITQLPFFSISASACKMTQNEMIMRKHIKNAQNTIKYAFENKIQLSGHTLPRSHLHQERLVPTYLVIKLEGGIIKMFALNYLAVSEISF